MTESMKFGPEWLRNLSGDSCSGGSGGSSISGTAGGGVPLSLTAPRYQLAEHRYGREEMLALFDQSYKAPEMLATFSTLYIDKTQLPLALIQMTEDESRIWNVSITSSSVRGRGGSVDRGARGRGGRGGLYSSHSRTIGFDDSGEGSRLESQAFPPRARPFDRSQSERVWSERNGVTEPGDWNGSSTSPRKELSRGASGSSLMENNWRRQRGNSEDEDGWRIASNARGEKWGRTSWRDASGMERERVEGDGDGDIRSGGRWEHRGNHRVNYDSSHHPPHRTARTWESNHHENHDNLPEWVTENSSESGGGSFDALGAFHGGGMFSDEEGDEPGNSHELPRPRRVSESNSFKSSNNIKPSASASNISGSNASQLATNRQPSSTMGKEKPKVRGSQQLNDDGDEPEEQEKTQPPIKPSLASDLKKSSTATNKSVPEAKPPKLVQQVVIDDIEKKNDPLISRSVIDESHKLDKKKVSSPNHKQQQQQAPKNHEVQETKANTLKQQKSECDLDRMKEEADALVAKLMADESVHRKGMPNISNQPPAGIDANAAVKEKWFYRDPQGEVQGPFLASEMAEWWKQGYFSASLLIRRSCDERYVTLGDLMTMCGRVPFEPGPPIHPFKLNEAVLPPVSSAVPTGMAANIPLSKPAIEDPLLLFQYQQIQLLQNQQLLLRQMRSSAIAKLSQSDHWATLSPIEQNQLVLQYISSQEAEVPEIPVPPNSFVAPPLATTQPPNPVMQLINQMQQAKTQADNHVPGNNHATGAGVHSGPMDPMIRLAGPPSAIPHLPTIPASNMTLPQSDDSNPIKMLLRQLEANGHRPQPLPLDSVWPQPPLPPPPHISAAQFNVQNWLPQAGHMPTLPPGHIPTSLWDMQCKDIEREQQQQQQQMMAKQNNHIQETKNRNDELKKQEEMKKKAEEEYARKKREEEQARLVVEENKKKKEEEKKRKEEEEKRKQEEEQRKREEKKRKEEEKKREEKRKLEEELNRRKQEEERKMKEAKKQEEKLKKEEEKRQKMEEEQARLEAERLKKEEEALKKAELEEQNRKAEQRRREAEALRKLQERNKAPWAQTPHAPSATTHASLAEIQRLEREKKADEQRLQQLVQQQQQQQQAQQKAVELAQEATIMDSSSKRTQFKWAEKTNVAEKLVPVKSLAQIQQEEQERIARVKQHEKEKQEKQAIQQKESAMVLQSTGIWGTASQNLNWTTSTGASSTQPWGSVTTAVAAAAAAAASITGSSGFWDDPALGSKSNVMNSKTGAKQQPASSSPPLKATVGNANAQQQLIKSSKNKNKKEEELVKKLFEQNTVKTDDFTLWCNKALTGLQVTVDIPTFVGFLRDIESPYEVKEYVRMYLGEAKQCMEFAKQFLEKRSKWRSAQRPQVQADDLCKPAPAVNPNAALEFQEVKGKAKKPKKGKMFKVDNRILGFSVTSAPDRINVGDRDYGEGM